MYLHPDQFLLIAKSRIEEYDKHAAIHRAELDSRLRANRRAARTRRWFRLRHCARSLLFRFVPGLARRPASVPCAGSCCQSAV